MLKIVAYAALFAVPCAAHADDHSDMSSQPASVIPHSSARPSAPGMDDLKTREGGELALSVGGYVYTELTSTAPTTKLMELTGPKVGIEYTQTLKAGSGRDWFASFNLRGSFGDVRYATPQGFAVSLVGDSSAPSRYSTRLVPAPGFAKPGSGRQGLRAA